MTDIDRNLTPRPVPGDACEITPVFVLHSPYPDGTWRGLEKCAGAADSHPLVFTDRPAAEKFLADHGDMRDFFRIVEVSLVVPSVRKPLDSATASAVERYMNPGTTAGWNGHAWELRWLSDWSLSVLCLDPQLVDGTDYTTWPSDEEVSLVVGRAVRFSDAGDSRRGAEGIFHVVSA